MTQVNKPALLRRLFQLGCSYSGQVLSYQKILGQLQERGNTTTLAHYLELLTGAGLITGMPKFAGQEVRKRGSSPRFMVLNTALITAQDSRNFFQSQEDLNYWGHVVESAVGAHLLNTIHGTQIKLYYWRESTFEVDFILEQGNNIIAIEVKSGKRKDRFSGLKRFEREFSPKKISIIGNEGILLEDFLLQPASYWMS